MKIQVSFRCDVCDFLLDWPDDADDSTPIVCKNCGAHHGTYRDLRDRAAQDAAIEVAAILKVKRGG